MRMRETKDGEIVTALADNPGLQDRIAHTTVHEWDSEYTDH